MQFDEETHFRALEYLRHAPDDPFMLAVSYTSPHPPYTVPKAYWEMYKDADVPLPDYPADMDEKYSDLDRAFRRWYGLDRESIRDPEHLLAMRRGFCALSHYVDDKLGELLDVLEDGGLRDSTMVMRPCFMVRLGPRKYIYIHRSRPQLFNLDDDLGEWINRAGDASIGDIEARLNHEVTGGSFDLDFIEKDIWERLAQKQVVNQAMALNRTSWDYRVEVDPATQYVRA